MITSPLGEVMSMSRLIATWIIAISLLITACYTIAQYNMDKAFLFGPECDIVEDDNRYWSA